MICVTMKNMGNIHWQQSTKELLLIGSIYISGDQQYEITNKLFRRNKRSGSPIIFFIDTPRAYLEPFVVSTFGAKHLCCHTCTCPWYLLWLSVFKIWQTANKQKVTGIGHLTYWGRRVTHICVSKLTIISSDNGLSPNRGQAIIWTNAVILLIGPLGTNFSETLLKFTHFSSRKCIWKFRMENSGYFVSAAMW